jgi:hypothetical protein
MDDRQMAETCAFQLGLERRFKEAGADGPRLNILLDVASQLATIDHPTDQHVMTAVKQAAALYLL